MDFDIVSNIVYFVKQFENPKEQREELYKVFSYCIEKNLLQSFDFNLYYNIPIWSLAQFLENTITEDEFSQYPNVMCKKNKKNTAPQPNQESFNKNTYALLEIIESKIPQLGKFGKKLLNNKSLDDWHRESKS